MADLIAKISKSNAANRDASHSHSHPSHLRSQDPPQVGSGNREASARASNVPHVSNSNREVKAERKRPTGAPRLTSFDSNSSSSDVELNDILHNRYPRREVGFEVNMKSEVQVHVEKRNSFGDSTKDGSD